jgi:protein-S-isoprenylcysteine O-methyltransferase Ste14
VGQGILMLAVVGLAAIFPGGRANRTVFFSGVFLLAVGALCGLVGAVALGRGLTPLPKPSDETRLVEHGIYRFVRHPLYTSVMAASLGWALVWRSWPAGLAALTLIPFLDAKARREERWLRAKFPGYSDYARRVRRFVPGIY